MRSIDFSKKWKRIGSGAFASYYKMSKTKGIKILVDGDKYEALDELSLIKKANKKTDMAPKGYEVVRVYFYKNSQDEYYQYGIIMQHLNARRVCTLGPRIKDRFYKSLESRGISDYDIEDYVHEKLRRQGVFHDDCHTANILAKVKNGKITRLYVVDFTPEMVYFGRPQKW